MNISFKNKWLLSLVVMLASTGFNDVLAAPTKAWTKDANGQVLVYPSEKVIGDKAAGQIICSIAGAAIIYNAATGNWSFLQKSMLSAFGVLFTGAGLYEFSNLKDEPIKPLIIIDNQGMVYEGRKILWKNVCGYECVRNTIKSDGRKYADYLEISTDINKWQIHEDQIAITLKMLYKLVDESYAEYKSTNINKRNRQAAVRRNR